MLVIRMQRTGRKGHAQFRVVVQDSRRTPTSGKIVASLGSYDPHAKTTTLDKEKAQFYLDHGAQPSDRVVRLLAAEGVKLPKWVNAAVKKESAVRNPDKRRSTRPAEEVVEEAPVAEETDATPAEKVDEVATEVAVEEATAEPAESTEKIAEAEEVASDAAAKADEADVTDENQDAAEEPAPEA